MSTGTRLLGVAAGLAASRALPVLGNDVHPVARFGATMTEVETRLWRDDRAAGVAYASIGAALGAISGRAGHSVTAVVAICAAGRQLRSTASAIGASLERGDLRSARDALPALVGRDASSLDESGVAAAVIESVAENSVDAVFGPALWGAVAGGAGAGLHRALNTMDAMVGRRSERYENFGWAAARADDIANFVPARVFALTLAVVTPGRTRIVLEAVRRDAAAHPSPNAGVAEAAMAGALGVELGGPLRYGTEVEERPTLGSGPRPATADIARAVHLARRTEDVLIGALVASGALALVRSRR